MAVHDFNLTVQVFLSAGIQWQRVCCWGMGLYWGHAVSQNAKGHPIGHVKVGQQPSLTSDFRGMTSCHNLLL